MRFLLLVFSLLLSFESFSQRMDEQGNQWSIASWNFGNNEYSTDVYRIEGTEVINDTLYSKFIHSKDSLTNNWTNSDYLIRQDSTKKVFLRTGPTSKEYLWFDFDLSVGETFNPEFDCSFEVISIDSVLFLNGEKRKRLTLEVVDNPEWDKLYWIEGMGTTYGLFDYPRFCLWDYNRWLLCFSDQEAIQYPENPETCFLVNHENLEILDYQIYPNPTKDYVLVKNSEHDIVHFSIINQMGVSIKSGKLYGNIVDVNDLPPGNYFLILQNEYNKKVSKRIIKH